MSLAGRTSCGVATQGWACGAAGVVLMLLMPAAARGQCPLSFGPQTAFPAGTTPYSVGAGDFDRDGKLDLVVADYGAGVVSLLRGNGNSTFQAPVAYAVGSAPFGVAVGDLRGNGAIDVVTTN